MDEIRFIELDENYLVLETLSGEKFKLSVDDGLRAALKNPTSEKLDEVVISPREIQEQIRTGSTVSDLVAATGVSESLIAKFAAPVLDEIAHIVNTAQAVRLTVASDRPNTTEHVEFGEIIESRLRLSGGYQIEWSAKKLEGSTWRIRLEFSLGDQLQEAAWLFEPRKLSLAPDNDMAIRLSTEESITASTKPNLAVVVEVPKQSHGEGISAPSESSPEDDSHSLSHQVDVDQALTLDLLDSLRRKRENRKEKPVDAESHVNEVEDNPTDPLEPAAESSVEPLVIGETELRSETGQDASPKKGRASMPSWDQIVFGTKAED